MVAIEFILFWAPIAFGFFAAASFVGTKLALRSYFDDEAFGITDAFRVENNEGDQ